MHRILSAFNRAQFNYFSYGTIPSQSNPKRIAADYFVAESIPEPMRQSLRQLIPGVQFGRTHPQYAPELIRECVIVPRNARS